MSLSTHEMMSVAVNCVAFRHKPLDRQVSVIFDDASRYSWLDMDEGRAKPADHVMYSSAVTVGNLILEKPIRAPPPAWPCCEIDRQDFSRSLHVFKSPLASQNGKHARSEENEGVAERQDQSRIVNRRRLVARKRRADKFVEMQESARWIEVGNGHAGKRKDGVRRMCAGWIESGCPSREGSRMADMAAGLRKAVLQPLEKHWRMVALRGCTLRTFWTYAYDLLAALVRCTLATGKAAFEAAFQFGIDAG